MGKCSFFYNFEYFTNNWTVAISYTYIFGLKYCHNSKKKFCVLCKTPKPFFCTVFFVFVWNFKFSIHHTKKKTAQIKNCIKKPTQKQVWVFYISNNRTCFNKKPTCGTSQVSTSFLNLYWVVKSVSHMLYFGHSFHMSQETYN